MAASDYARSPRSSFSRRHPNAPPSILRNDWTATGEPPLPDSPRWARREDIEPYAYTFPNPTSPRHPPFSRPRPPSSSPSMRNPQPGVPVLTRTVAASVRRPALIYEEEDRSRSDSRRSGSRRERSPPSAHLYRSTPDSARSSRTSLSDSDTDTESTTSTRGEPARKSRPEKLLRVPQPPRRRTPRRAPHRAEIIYEEVDEYERPTRYDANPFLDRSRSISRPSADRRVDHRRAQTDVGPRRSFEESRSRSRSNRINKKYYEVEVVSRERNPSSVRRSNTTGGSNGASSQSAASSARRSSFLGSFFGSSLQVPIQDRPVKLVECVVCLDDGVPYHRSARLKCGHRMCNSCLKRSFRLSIQDPQHMPPRCCTTDHIPLKHVERLFDNRFKRTWNRKFAEFSTRNRVYCPSRRCGEWIKPHNIFRDSDGRKAGECGRCGTKVCCRCNGKWHRSRDCPRDEETNLFLAQAKREGWQRCHRCKAMVELKEGCNHMTCRCGAEFCMICGSKWKTCDCPWFNQDAVENDRLEHMQIPVDVTTDPVTMMADRFDPGPRSPRNFRSGGGTGMTTMRSRPHSYEEEVVLRRRHEQQRGDGHTRRPRAFGDFEDPDDHDADTKHRRHRHDDRYDDDMTDGVDAGPRSPAASGPGPFVHDDYRRGPPGLVVPPPPPPQQQQPGHPDRANSGPDYVSGVNRARGVRASSLERRLAERFNTDLRQSPMRNQAPGPAPPPIISSPPTTIPVAPTPPPAVPMAAAPVLRRHTMEEDLYNSARSTRPSERVVPGRVRHDYDSEAIVHAPQSRRRRHHSNPQNHHNNHHPAPHHQYYQEQQHQAPQQPQPLPIYESPQAPKMSELAGLAGPGRGMNRVFEWRTHVEPGNPDEEEASTIMSI